MFNLSRDFLITLSLCVYYDLYGHQWTSFKVRDESMQWPNCQTNLDIVLQDNIVLAFHKKVQQPTTWANTISSTPLVFIDLEPLDCHPLCQPLQYVI